MASKHTFNSIRILLHFILVIAPVSLDGTVAEEMGDCADNTFGNCSSVIAQQSISQFESTSTNQADAYSYVIDENVTLGTHVSSAVNTTLIDDIINTSSTTEQMSDATLEETTVPAATTKLPEHQSKSDEVLRHIPEDLCMCDLQIDSCDINCCCDRDCTEEDRQVFLNCDIKIQHPFSRHFCFQKQHIYRNNTEFKVITNSDGLFCIYKENLPKEFYLSQKKVFSSTKQMNKAIAAKERVDWPSQEKKEWKFNLTRTYAASDLIWIANNLTFLPLSFPSQLFNKFCQTVKPLHYLESWSGDCVQPLVECDININLNAESYFMNLRIIGNPNLINRTDTDFDLQECPPDVCIPVIPYLCQGISPYSLKTCQEVEYITKPTIHKNVCRNIVQRIYYIIHHNGTQGICKVEAFFWLTNVTLNLKWFTQEHSVSFTWAGKPRIPMQRSGMPGYIKGKPVMAGHKVYQLLEYDSETGKEAILLDEDSFNWLSLVKGSKDGTCGLDLENGNREVITFGENRQTSCILYLKLTNFSSASSCSLIQAFILKLLVGDDISNVTDAQQFNKYVATFGDASIENTGDWVQMFLENIPKKTIAFERHNQYTSCKNIITSLHMSIAYAFVGSVNNPQAKIVGASLKFGSSHDILFNCFPVNCQSLNSNKTKQIEISSSVSFYDVSTPSKYHFAELPVYEVKLPYDFFYPFLSSKSSKYMENSIVNNLLLIFLNCFIVLSKCLQMFTL